MKQVKHQHGATLVEVMITALLLATCLLSMAILQKRSLQFNQGAYLRSQANIHVYDILDRMRLNRDNMNNYNVAYGAAAAGGGLAAADVTDWNSNIERYLPEGEGAIACDVTTRVCRISIRWSEEQLFNKGSSQATACSAVSESCSELIYTTIL